MRYHYTALEKHVCCNSQLQGKHVYERASTQLKRVQCNMGAKCVSVVMPDAHKKTLLKQVGILMQMCDRVIQITNSFINLWVDHQFFLATRRNCPIFFFLQKSRIVAQSASVPFSICLLTYLTCFFVRLP